MKIEEALQFADQWTEGHTFYEGMQGWRVVCAVLAAEVRRYRKLEAVGAKLATEFAKIKCTHCMDTGEQLGVYGRIKCGCKTQEAEAVPYLVNGTRYKVHCIKGVAGISGLPTELNGQWVALVDATDDKHMKHQLHVSIPEKMNVLYQMMAPESIDYINGWNACVDAFISGAGDE